MPGDLFDRLQEAAQSVVNNYDEPAIKRPTYAAVAHFILDNIKDARARPDSSKPGLAPGLFGFERAVIHDRSRCRPKDRS